MDVLAMLGQWHLDVSAVRENVYGAPTPRERQRWLALWLLDREWSATPVAEDLGRDAHAIGNWLEDFRHGGPTAMAFEQSGGSPPPPSTRHNKRN